MTRRKVLKAWTCSLPIIVSSNQKTMHPLARRSLVLFLHIMHQIRFDRLTYSSVWRSSKNQCVRSFRIPEFVCDVLHFSKTLSAQETVTKKSISSLLPINRLVPLLIFTFPGQFLQNNGYSWRLSITKTYIILLRAWWFFSGRSRLFGIW